MNEPSQEKVILVVDDTPMNITVLAQILKERYRIKVAKDGERALKIARAAPAPALILLDVVMPGMDGYDVCRALKADAATRDIPVVFVTGMSEGGDQARGLGLGAVGYLTKPVDAATVMGKLQEVLG
jgi:putative two-component system response regulator